jgi:fructose-specific phosphotransferase system IIC component
MLKTKTMAITFAVFTFFIEITGWIWHGLLGEPSLISLAYPGFWSNYALMLYGLIGSVVYAFIVGYVFAWIYNWAEKKFK